MSDQDIYSNSDYLARHPEMLEELETETVNVILQDQDIYRIDTTDPNAYLWAGTFDIWNKNGPLEHYYNTYAITNDGMIAGSYNPRSPYYRVLSEFSDMAFKLHYYLPDWREKYEDLWRDALTAALDNCNAQ